MSAFLNGFFDGKLKLWKAYLFCITGVGLSNILLAFLYYQFTHHSLILKTITAIHLSIWLYFFIGAWRCAGNTNNSFATTLTKVLLCASALSAIRLMINSIY